MKQNKKIWKIGVLFSLFIIILLVRNADASWFGDIFGGGHCYSWMPPKTAQACDQCGVINNVAGLVPCTDYSCHSLGVDCVFDETTKLCTEQSTNDRSAPSITECKAMDLMTQKYYTVEKKNMACSISGQVEAYSAVAFYLTLDEAGTCSISEDPAFNFEDGEQLITETGGISKNQFFIYPTGSGEFNCNGMCTFYVKCADYNGNIMDSYTLEFIAKEAPDKAPPIILGYSLTSGAHILQSTTSINPFHLVAMDNEGVKECRYSSSSTADYNSAELMECSSTIDIDAGGWKCTKMGGLTTTANENKYYFKCKDVNNNVMPNWNEFKLLKVTSTLNVGITSPGAEIKGTNNMLKVGVSGYEQGVSSCLYDIKWRAGGDTTELTPSTEMIKESEGIYSLSLSLANSGRYDVKVECTDGVGQSATDEKSFNYVNEPLKFTFNPASVASATQNNFLDAVLAVSGGRNGKGDTSECRYKRFGISDDLSAVKFSDLNVVLPKSAPQIYQITFNNLLSGINRFYVMCEDFDARGNYYGEEYKINFNPGGLAIEQQPSHSEIRQTANGYGLDLYLVLSGGPDADGSATCYYNDKFISGMYTSFSTSQYKDSFTKGDVIDYSGKEARKYTKTVSISPNVLVDFYIRCADKYNGLTNTIKHSVLYTSSGGTTPECTSNSDCYSGEICNAYGICVSSDGGTITGTGPLSVLSVGPSGNIGNKNVKLYMTLTGGVSEFGKNLNCYYNTNYDPIFERSTGITLAEFNQFFNVNRLDQSELLDSSNGGPGTRYYKMLNLANGNYTYYAACKDSADTVSEVRRIGFSISEDITPPILQFYTEGSLFKVRLNERGSCFVKQGDNWGEMSADSDGVIHSTPVRTDKTYMIKCKDSWNNWRPGPTENDFITVVKNG